MYKIEVVFFSNSHIYEKSLLDQEKSRLKSKRDMIFTVNFKYFISNREVSLFNIS